MSVEAAYGHTCAVTVGGSVFCWGRGSNGRLGYASTGDVGDDETPEDRGAVEIGGQATSVATGAAHTCAVLTDGNLVCWGAGSAGRLGYGNEADVGDNEMPTVYGTVHVFGQEDT